jgi:hypothetical protein
VIFTILYLLSSVVSLQRRRPTLFTVFGVEFIPILPHARAAAASAGFANDKVLTRKWMAVFTMGLFGIMVATLL